jgi:hypothetical protein
MGSKLMTDRGKGLYEFWGDRVAKQLQEHLAQQEEKERFLVNGEKNLNALSLSSFLCCITTRPAPTHILFLSSTPTSIPLSPLHHQLNSSFILQVASNEYWKVVKPFVATLDCPVFTIEFPGPSVYAKEVYLQCM